ncbi:MAG: hypothetical protein LLF83_00840 [Methanobacterium sp.]|nr:hypothetical protein [Methanobacterium sp.]
MDQVEQLPQVAMEKLRYVREEFFKIYEDKTKEELIEELEKLKDKVSELENKKTEYKQVNHELKLKSLFLKILLIQFLCMILKEILFMSPFLIVVKIFYSRKLLINKNWQQNYFKGHF